MRRCQDLGFTSLKMTVLPGMTLCIILTIISFSVEMGSQVKIKKASRDRLI